MQDPDHPVFYFIKCADCLLVYLPHLPPTVSIALFLLLPYTVLTGHCHGRVYRKETRKSQMDTIKTKILDSIRETGSYHYSTDPARKLSETEAVKELEADGLITLVTKAVGYVNAKTL